MSILLNDNVYINAGKPSEAKSLNGVTLYTSVTHVNNIIPISERYLRLTVQLPDGEYWYYDDVTNSDLILKQSSTSIIGYSGLTVTGDVTGLTTNSLLNLNLNNVTSGQTIGSSTQIPIITYDNKGRIISGYTVTVSGVTTQSITTTVSAFQALNGIYQVSTTYIITDADVSLYSGTTIYLTTNGEGLLNERGLGKFYNPKYDQTVSGFNVWTNLSSFVATPTTGTWTQQYPPENIFALNTTATGKLFTTINGTKFIPLTGDWSIVTSIQGETTGAQASISGVVLKSYNNGDLVHWGGKTWERDGAVTNGLVGTADDIYTLSGGWTSIMFDPINYNVVYDEIIYDVENDLIVYRNEQNSNIVSINKGYIDGRNPIKDFMWGNVYSEPNYKGIGSQTITNSYNGNINFRGSYQYYLTFENNSSQEQLTFENNSFQSNLIFGNNSHQYNLTFENNSSQEQLTFENYSFQNNLTFENNSYQYYLTFKNNSSQQDSTFENNSYQQNLTFENNSFQGYLTVTGKNQTSISFNNYSYDRTSSPMLANETNLEFKGDLPTITTLNSTTDKIYVKQDNQVKEITTTNLQALLNLNLNNVTSGQTIGSSTQIPIITYDNKGRIISGYTVTVSGVTTQSITTTVSAFQALNGIYQVSTTYIITDADVSLYSGTTIYLTTNGEGLLNERGLGKFFNPKYDQNVAGFNVWTLNGSYIIGDLVHWGGKTWENINGNTGSSIDIYTLDSEWLAKNFNEVDYNVVYDEIKYDSLNDLIVYRNEQNNNIVSMSKDYAGYYGIGYNPIKAFMWGNTLINGINVGIGPQIITNSYNENINFRGLYQSYLNLNNASYQKNIIFDNGSFQQNLTFNSVSYQENLTFDNNSSQENLTFDNLSNQSNLTFDNNSFQENLTFDNYSYQNNLSFSNNSTQNAITFDNYSYQNNLSFSNNSTQNAITFSNYSNQNNLIFSNNSNQSNLTFENGSAQQYLTFENNSTQNTITFENVSSQDYLTEISGRSQTTISFNNYYYNRTSLPMLANETNLEFKGDLPTINTLNSTTDKIYVKQDNQVKEITTVDLQALIGGSGGVSTFSALTDSPYDNPLLADALNSKQDRLAGIVSGCDISVETFSGVATNKQIRVTSGTWYIPTSEHTKATDTVSDEITLCPTGGDFKYYDIVADDANAITIHEGTPSTAPAHYVIDPLTEVLLGFITVGDAVIEEPVTVGSELLRGFNVSYISPVNIDLSTANENTLVDGFPIGVNFVLLPVQDNTSENGIYTTYANGSLTFPFRSWVKITSFIDTSNFARTLFFATFGSVNAGAIYNAYSWIGTNEYLFRKLGGSTTQSSQAQVEAAFDNTDQTTPVVLEQTSALTPFNAWWLVQKMKALFSDITYVNTQDKKFNFKLSFNGVRVIEDYWVDGGTVSTATLSSGITLLEHSINAEASYQTTYPFVIAAGTRVFWRCTFATNDFSGAANCKGEFTNNI